MQTIETKPGALKQFLLERDGSLLDGDNFLFACGGSLLGRGCSLFGYDDSLLNDYFSLSDRYVSLLMHVRFLLKNVSSICFYVCAQGVGSNTLTERSYRDGGLTGGPG